MAPIKAIRHHPYRGRFSEVLQQLHAFSVLTIFLLLCPTSFCQSDKLTSSLSLPLKTAKTNVPPFGTVLSGSRRGSTSNGSFNSRTLAPSLTSVSSLKATNLSTTATVVDSSAMPKQVESEISTQPLTEAESSNIVHQFKFAFHNRPSASHRSSMNSNDDELLLLGERIGSAKLPPNSRLYEAYDTGNGRGGGRTSTSLHAHYLPGSTSAIYVDSSEELVDDFVAASHQPKPPKQPNQPPNLHLRSHHHHSLFSQDGPSKYVAVTAEKNLGLTESENDNEMSNQTIKNFVIPLPTHRLNDRSLATGVIVISQDNNFPAGASADSFSDNGGRIDDYGRQFHYELLTSIPASLNKNHLSQPNSAEFSADSRQVDSAERVESTADDLAETEAEEATENVSDENQTAKREVVTPVFGHRSTIINKKSSGVQNESGGQKLSALTITMENQLNNNLLKSSTQNQRPTELSNSDNYIASSLKARIHLTRPSTNSFNIDLVKTTTTTNTASDPSNKTESILSEKTFNQSNSNVVNEQHSSSSPASTSLLLLVERETMLNKIRGKSIKKVAKKEVQTGETSDANSVGSEGRFTGSRSRRRQQHSFSSSPSRLPSITSSINLLNSVPKQSNFILKQRRNDKLLRLNTITTNDNGNASNSTSTTTTSTTTEKPSSELTTKSILNSLVKELNLALKDRLRQLESYNQTVRQALVSSPETATTEKPGATTTSLFFTTTETNDISITTTSNSNKGKDDLGEMTTAVPLTVITTNSSSDEAANFSSEEDDDDEKINSVKTTTTSSPEIITTTFTSNSSESYEFSEESKEEDSDEINLTTIATINSTTTTSPPPASLPSSSSEEENEEEDNSSEENTPDIVTTTTTSAPTTTTFAPTTTTSTTTKVTTTTTTAALSSTTKSSFKKDSRKKLSSKSSSTAIPTANSTSAKKSKTAKSASLKNNTSSKNKKNSDNSTASASSTTKVTIKPQMSTVAASSKNKNSSISDNKSNIEPQFAPIQLRMNVSLTNKQRKLTTTISKNDKSKLKNSNNLNSAKKFQTIEGDNKKSSNKTLRFELDTLSSKHENNSKIDKNFNKQQKKREKSLEIKNSTISSVTSSTTTTPTPSTTSKWNSGQLIWSLWNPTSGTTPKTAIFISTTTSKPTTTATFKKQQQQNTALLERRPPGPPKIPNNFGFANEIHRDSHIFDDEIIDSDEDDGEAAREELAKKLKSSLASGRNQHSSVNIKNASEKEQSEKLKKVERKRDFDDDDDNSGNDENDSEDDLADTNVPGTPGIDYPILGHIPETSFDCSRQQYPGFYSDMEVGCQVYHSCSLASIPKANFFSETGTSKNNHQSSSLSIHPIFLNTSESSSNPVSRILSSSGSRKVSNVLNGGKHSFLCPNGTIFSQEYLICDWWYNVKCDESPRFYPLNRDVFTSGGGGGDRSFSLEAASSSSPVATVSTSVFPSEFFSTPSTTSTTPTSAENHQFHDHINSGNGNKNGQLPSRTDTLASTFVGISSLSSVASQQNSRPSLLFSTPHFSNNFQHF